MKCRTKYADIFSESEFVLVVITVDGSQVNFYRNGIRQAPTDGTANCAYQIDGSEDILHLGSNSFGGTMKSFAVWDRALSQDEVTDLGAQLTCPSMPSR